MRFQEEDMDRFLGCIYGLAIGDALGYPYEFGYKGAALNVSGLREPALYSDDTQMSLAIAQALIDAAKTNSLNDVEAVMDKVVRRFIQWYRSPDNNRAPGMTCMEGCRRLAEGVSWRESGVATSKGCGTAMRTAPVGLVYHNDPQMLKEISAATSTATHRHPAAIAGGVATAYLVALAVKNTQPQRMPEELLKFTAGMSSDFTQKIELVSRVVRLQPDEAFAEIGEGWVAEEAVAGALYCFLRHPTDYRQCVLTAVNFSGDRDSVACIAGAISGAYNGIAAIPPEWTQKIENRQLLREVAENLYKVAIR
ncbi:MAG: hypothetical protein DRP63_01760 [Planctomycetota bacterium]|nr:MAG: hypothetical protein DRP63_01760 [Planctomycetota bacterium]